MSLTSAVPVIPPGRPRPLWPWLLGLIVLASCVPTLVDPLFDDDPADVVADYLDAIRRHDVPEALARVERVPIGLSGSFLTEKSIVDDLTVDNVRVQTATDYLATVTAELSVPGDTATGWFDLRRMNGTWLLQDPFVEITVGYLPVSYLRINEQVVPLPDNPDNRLIRMDLFPGAHRFFAERPELLTVADQRTVLLAPPANNPDPLELPQGFGTIAMGPEATESTRQAFDDYLDDCVQFTTARPNECPFAVNSGHLWLDDHTLYGLHDLRWRLVDRPTVHAESVLPTADGPEGFPLTATTEGAIELTGSALDDKGKTVDFSLTCELELDGLVAVIDADGSATIEGGVPHDNTCHA